jgi:hypothetical protein
MNATMDPLDAYAPPKIALTDAGGAVPRIPRLFRGTLIVLVLLQMLSTIAMPTVSGTLLFGLTAFAAWKTLQHHRAGSRLLGVLLVFDSLLFYAIASGIARDSLAVAAIVFAFAVCALVLSGYLFFSPSMRAVFRKAEATKWGSA